MAARFFATSSLVVKPGLRKLKSSVCGFLETSRVRVDMGTGTTTHPHNQNILATNRARAAACTPAIAGVAPLVAIRLIRAPPPREALPGSRLQRSTHEWE